MGFLSKAKPARKTQRRGSGGLSKARKANPTPPRARRYSKGGSVTKATPKKK